MADLIDRDALQASIIENSMRIKFFNPSVNVILQLIQCAPTVLKNENAQTIETESVRQGHWIDNGEDKFICSSCEGHVYRIFGRCDFCPRCGAKMLNTGGVFSQLYCQTEGVD